MADEEKVEGARQKIDEVSTELTVPKTGPVHPREKDHELPESSFKELSDTIEDLKQEVWRLIEGLLQPVVDALTRVIKWVKGVTVDDKMTECKLCGDGEHNTAPTGTGRTVWWYFKEMRGTRFGRAHRFRMVANDMMQLSWEEIQHAFNHVFDTWAMQIFPPEGHAIDEAHVYDLWIVDGLEDFDISEDYDE